ncbi:uncharacterized protein LY79DRAFT_96475 [Colletotrichum navitas]|uniref:Uncharacterized protein n=1 Tax=Colletotrichum navitas TaxID=681940 RepID=A0AAD8UZ02_9PEZI|nr:uncharacterized protein LY79DRAFT_96475 [Colletotrichum navitas]KAK1566391.1 hypothetical protein LY79DRAFT_96475 [Colletotrichum navitas]
MIALRQVSQAAPVQDPTPSGPWPGASTARRVPPAMSPTPRPLEPRVLPLVKPVLPQPIPSPPATGRSSPLACQTRGLTRSSRQRPALTRFVAQPSFSPLESLSPSRLKQNGGTPQTAQRSSLAMPSCRAADPPSYPLLPLPVTAIQRCLYPPTVRAAP